MNFADELKKRIKKIDEATIGPEPKEEQSVIFVVKKKYNIHKRSLPVGIDYIVVFNVTESEAKWWTENILLAKSYHDHLNNTKTVIYYDILPVGATPKQRNVYYNDSTIIKEID